MLVMVRHGESEGNVLGLLCGQLNYDLTPTGIEQAIDTAVTLMDYEFDAVFSSDLQRAVKTAEAIMERNRYPTPITFVEELRERSGGLHEGKSYESLKKLLPPKKYKLWQRDYFEAPILGESMSDVADRVRPFLKEMVIPRLEQNKNVLIISHATTLKVMFGLIGGMKEEEVPPLEVENAIPYFFYGRAQL